MRRVSNISCHVLKHLRRELNKPHRRIANTASTFLEIASPIRDCASDGRRGCVVGAAGGGAGIRVCLRGVAGDGAARRRYGALCAVACLGSSRAVVVRVRARTMVCLML